MKRLIYLVFNSKFKVLLSTEVVIKFFYEFGLIKKIGYN